MITFAKNTMITISNCNFAGKKAIIRVDYNVPLDENFRITDDTRMRATIPTLHKIIADGGSIILMSHLGRPKEGPTEKYSLKQQVKQKREITIKAYQDSFFKNIIEYNTKVVSPMKIYNQGLSEIIQKLDESCHEIAKINQQMQEDFEKLK